MDWLWLFLGLIGLGLLWLLIIGLEKLTERMKEQDEARRIAEHNVAERTAQAESDFLIMERAKASAKDYIETAQVTDDNDKLLSDAIDLLSSEELIDSFAKRALGNPKDTNDITAAQSVFDQTPVRKKAVAKGSVSAPVKVKSSDKSALSKSEQKMLKKIKQGD